MKVFELRFNRVQELLCLLVTILATTLSLHAREREDIKPAGEKGTPQVNVMMKMAGCAGATAQRDLDVNNVRTTILNGGDFWWNLSNARYEVPKVQPGQVSKHSLFAGALWIGGVTKGNLRIAAQTYRQSGNDFFPGPLTITGSIKADRCKTYDKIWKITLSEINTFRNNPSGWSSPSDEILTWPCHGDVKTGEAKYLAPFVDANGNGEYEPYLGDYPSFDQNNTKNIPDMMLFILSNDKGNIHSETQSSPIGLELQTQAFAFSTNDEVNNMTFYRTTVINRGPDDIDSCIFGQWVDADLGNYNDDYVECDVKRNLGICYNGDDNDEGILGYGLNPPSIGVNFFQGPINPKTKKEIGLTKFVYYNNNTSNTGDPRKPEDYWGYLNGKWRDGTSITYGGNGKGGADTASFMFPGNTDPAGRPAWTERNSQTEPGDRRFLQTAGPFSLESGAVNRVTIGVVWARASSGGATGSFNLLKEASDKALILFKNNFNLIAGPDAPKIEITELNRNLIFRLTGTAPIENFEDSFAGPCSTKTVYKFQGYQVFQLKTPNIPSDIYDQSQARLVAQFDLKDGSGRLVNTIFSPELEENVKKIMVTGADEGIMHSFQLNRDLFETGSDQTLVNFKNYHYVIFAYASAANCTQEPIQYLPGRKTINSNALVVYTATPHDRSLKDNGTQVNAKYGDEFAVTQIEGVGNGGKAVELSRETISEILTSPNYYAKNRTYVPGFGPVNIKVVDPLKLPEGDFVLYIRDTTSVSKKTDSLSAKTSFWYLKHNEKVIRGTSSIQKPYEQVFEEWGISVNIAQSMMPGDKDNLDDESNGYITSSIEWSNPVQQWLGNVKDEDPDYSPIPYAQGLTLAPQFNWIRSGNKGTPEFKDPETNDFVYKVEVNPGVYAKIPLDPRRGYSKIIDGTWSPYALAASWRTTSTVKMPSFGPAWDFGIGNKHGGGTVSFDNPMSDLYSVKVVFTSDKSLWTRCVVLEAGEYPALNVGNADKMDLRTSSSVDKNGKKGDGIASGDPNDADYISATGMGWFPGYAINIETGERLNIMFAEDSSLPGENGGDMIWNPTSRVINNALRPVFGGKHYMYIMGSTYSPTLGYKGPRYDAGKNYRDLLDTDPNIVSPSYTQRQRMLFSQAMWVSMPMLAQGYTLLTPESGIIPNTVTVNIKVKRPYASFATDNNTVNDSMPYFTFSTKGFAPVQSMETGRKALDKVNIVPNPYYAYSSYEDPGNQLANQVRLVNLPERCDIRVYTMDGVLVRTIRKSDASSAYTEWDLKNDAKVPISSGVYLIHIKAPDFAEERIIKWFGVMRPVDFDTF
jgi:hypothetical protein